MKASEISVERIAHNGHLVLSTIQDGQYIKRVYIGYTLAEAKRIFIEDVREELAKDIKAVE